MSVLLQILLEAIPMLIRVEPVQKGGEVKSAFYGY